MARANNVIFNCDEIVRACDEAKAKGEPLSTVFSIEAAARPGPNGTKYCSINCAVPGKRGRLMVRVVKEMHVGQIPPLDDAEVARINAESNSKYGGVKKRDRHPTINVQKYAGRVETDDAGNVVGELPSDDMKSAYYRFREYYDEFFYNEMRKRIDEGSIVVRDARRKDYPPGATVVSNAKIAPSVQTHISMESKSNPGGALANPICRTNMKFDKDTGMPKKVTFYDFLKPYRDAKTGKRRFEPLTFDGHPVTAHNVHLIRSHSRISGIVNMNAMCASNMGLSTPAQWEVVIVEAPAARGISLDDALDDGMFDDDDFPEGDGGVGAPPPADPADPADAAPADAAPADAAPADAAPADAAAADALAEDDLNDVLGDLGVN